MQLRLSPVTFFAVTFSLLSLLYSPHSFANWTLADMDRHAAEDVALSSGLLSYDQKTHTFTDTRTGITATLNLERQGFFTKEDYKMLTQEGFASYKDFRTGGLGRFDEKRKAIVWKRENELTREWLEIQVEVKTTSSFSADFDFILNPENLKKRDARMAQIQGVLTPTQYIDLFARGMRLASYILSVAGERRIKLLKTLFLHPLAVHLDKLIDTILDIDPSYGLEIFLYVLVQEPWISYAKTPALVTMALVHEFETSKSGEINDFLQVLFNLDINMEIVRPALMKFADTPKFRENIATTNSRSRDLMLRYLALIEKDMPLHAHGFRKALDHNPKYEGEAYDIEKRLQHTEQVINERARIINKIIILNRMHCVDNLVSEEQSKAKN